MPTQSDIFVVERSFRRDIRPDQFESIRMEIWRRASQELVGIESATVRYWWETTYHMWQPQRLECQSGFRLDESLAAKSSRIVLRLTLDFQSE
jgi:hypothetical protein